MSNNLILCKQGFASINKYKRHRALKETAATEAERNFHELQMFKMFDSIELTMRAIQQNERFSPSNASVNVEEEEETEK